MDYQTGLQALKSQLPSDGLEEFNVLEARLLDNLHDERMFGTTETSRADRARILAGLNHLAQKYLSTSFNALCPEAQDFLAAVESEKNEVSQEIFHAEGIQLEILFVLNEALRQGGSGRVPKDQLAQRFKNQSIDGEIRVLKESKCITETIQRFGGRPYSYFEITGRGIESLESSSSTPVNKHLLELRQKLEDHFNKEELCTLCFDLGIDHENLPSAKDGMVRELVKYCVRHRRISELAEACQDRRPNVSWDITPDIPTEGTAKEQSR